MAVFEKILYPTDFSQLAETAGKYVLRLKSAGAREVLVLHVIHPLEFSLPQFDDPFALDTATIYAHLPEIERETFRKYRELLDEISREFEKEGFSVRTLISVGNPADEIVKIAERERVNLIVMGYHGKGLIERLLEMGSTTKEVIRKARCPILVVKAGERDAE